MIEIDLKPGGDDSTQTRLGWVPCSKLIELHNVNFNRTRLRINGVVYTEKSEECVKEFNRAKFWMTLTDD